MYPPIEYDEFGRPRRNYTPVGGYTPVSGPVQPQTPAQMPPPNFDPINISPVAAMPAESRLASMRPIDSSDPRYHNSKIRTVLNAIAGGLAGASGGPKVGLEVGRSLHDAKLNSAVEQQNRELSLIEPQVAAEKEQRRVGEEQTKAGIQRGTAQSLDVTRRTRAEDDTIKAITQMQEHDRKVADDARKLKLSQSTMDARKYAQEHPGDPWKYMMSVDHNDPEAMQAALKEIKDFEAAKGSDAVAKQQSILDMKADPKNLQKIASVSAAQGSGGTSGRISASSTPSALAGEQAQAQARTAGTEMAKTSPEAIKGEAELSRAKSAAQLTANEKDVANKAAIALGRLPDIRTQIGAASDTLFADRWKEFRTNKLGTEDSQKYAALRTNVQLLQSLVTQIHIGNRGVSKILDKFEGLFNVDKMNKKTFEDSLNEVEKWIKAYSQLPPIPGGGKSVPENDISNIDKMISGPSKPINKYGITVK